MRGDALDSIQRVINLAVPAVGWLPLKYCSGEPHVRFLTIARLADKPLVSIISLFV